MRKATPEQIEASRARRAQFYAIAETIAKMPDADRAALAAKLPVYTIEGHPLSVFNQCLVASQNPVASIVGGFRQWIKAGRVVRKGQHGLMIWIPKAPKADQGKQEGETSSAEKTRFLAGTVFDILQTDVLTAGVEAQEEAA